MLTTVLKDAMHTSLCTGEAERPSLEIDKYDVDTVQRMIDCIYTGTYKPGLDSPPGPSSFFHFTTESRSLSTDEPATEFTFGGPPTSREKVVSHETPKNHAIIHARVALIAYEYGLTNAQTRANNMLLRHWMIQHNHDEYIRFVKDVIESGVFKALETGLYMYAKCFGGILAEKPEFTQLELPRSLSVAISSKPRKSSSSDAQKSADPSSNQWNNWRESSLQCQQRRCPLNSSEESSPVDVPASSPLGI
ncbi:hypothetical protein KEM56_002363 [Ascosphaera pollenicola]|nr:hypothetical protein KEM56_002363 [Ascosphaera pollenicola]